MKRMLSSILAATVLLAGACSGADDPAAARSGELTFSPETLTLTDQAATQAIAVTATADWGVVSEDTSWCRVAPSGGVAGTSEIRVAVDENKTGEARTTNLVFRIGNDRKILPVKQHYQVEAVEIADPAFLTYLLENYDTDGDGILSTKEAAAVTRIEASGRGIRSMAELNTIFPQLTYLDCSDNDLTELDLTELTKLAYLDCSGNRLTELDIRNQQSLTTFDATGNPDLRKIHVWTGFQAGDGFSKPEKAEYVESEIPTPAGYRLVWADEFNASGESLPSVDRWWYETGDGGWGNHELQDYVSGGQYQGEKLALVSNGTLKIIAKKIDGKVRSVRMNTLEGWTYGYFEARLKLCSGKGTWPAFWMMPKNFKTWPGDGEIDIMEEVGYNPNYVSSSIHCNAYNHSIGTQKTHELLLPTAQEEFHTYAVEWTEEMLIFYFDGEEHFRFVNDKKGNYDTWPFYNPFYLKLNLAWGGDWGGAQGIDESCLPATYEVDYVRVFKKIE
ncbi:MAG: family 16 glycosylhydrolase [Alistipes sp.]|nr:family 16 glycosylhydrolase [Alistipes senegalensis]MCM1250966.1 family 16 glycosylhydrolase [Alistipes sp.]